MKNPVSSDLARALALLDQLRSSGRLLVGRRPPPPAATPPAAAPPAAAAPPTAAAPPAPPPLEPRSPAIAPPAATPAPPPAAPPAPPPAAAPAAAPAPPATKASPPDGGYREERMRRLLAEMCKRGGFSGAVLADGSGLPLADYNPPFDSDALAAYSSILGGALDQAGRLLGKRDANHLSLDLNYVDKIVTRRFRVGEQDCCLLVVCPQSTDERSELELSIDEILTILSPSS